MMQHTINNTTEGETMKDNRQSVSYDYDLQVWTRDGIIEQCGHAQGANRCAACVCAGLTVEQAKAVRLTQEG